jgi:hypothetical protein
MAKKALVPDIELEVTPVDLRKLAKEPYVDLKFKDQVIRLKLAEMDTDDIGELDNAITYLQDIADDLNDDLDDDDEDEDLDAEEDEDEEL